MIFGFLDQNPYNYFCYMVLQKPYNYFWLYGYIVLNPYGFKPYNGLRAKQKVWFRS